MIAHIDAGKTSVTEGMLFYSGLVHRLGSIDDGTAVMDYLEEERNRGITITAAAATLKWADSLVHLIDTPGHIDFTVEVERSLRVIDGAVVIFSAVEGVEAQSEKVWHQSDEYQVPKLAFINKLDRAGASFSRVLEEINAKFDLCSVPVQIPYGEEDNLQGIVDLIGCRLLRFEGEQNDRVVAEPVPDDIAVCVKGAREKLLETLADFSDELAASYLEGESLSPEFIKKTVRSLTVANKIVPVFAGSAKQNVGIQPLMDGVIEFLPSPLDRGEVNAKAKNDQEGVVIHPDPEEPFAGLVFKVLAGPSADLLYVRTYSGTLRKGNKIVNSRTGDKSAVKQMFRLFAGKTESIDQVKPGDIVGIIGPPDCDTGDTLCHPHRVVSCETMHFPEPVISIAIEPHSVKEKDRLAEALRLICREDPTLRLGQDEETGQWLMSGMGELHLEVNLKRIREQFNIQPKAGEPRVAYRETFKNSGKVEAEFHKFLGEKELQSGIQLHIEPFVCGSQVFEIGNKLKERGDLPKSFARVAEDALRQALQTGGQHGYPLVYVKANILDLQFYPDKSNESAVTGAVLSAVDKAVHELQTKVLEPLMYLEIMCPPETVGEVTNYLQPRRAVIHEMTKTGDVKRVHCDVPLAEMFGFGKAFPKLTGGRGSFAMEPRGYQDVPPDIASKMFGDSGEL